MLLVIVMPLVAVEEAVRAVTGMQTVEGDGLTTVMGLWYLVVFGLYDPVATKALGASVGKRLLGLRIERASGGPAETRRVAGRWFVELLLLGLCFVPGILSIAAARNQRLRQAWHDQAADTVVVRVDAERSRPPDLGSSRPGLLAEPWASLVLEARAASERFDRTTAAAVDGPVKGRLVRVRTQVQGCVVDCERLAGRGAEVAALAAAVDLPRVEARAQAAAAEAAVRTEDRDAQALAVALKGEAGSARRLTELVAATERRLRRSVAQLNDAVNRSAQVVFDSSDPARFDHLVDEFTALQAALAEMESGLGPGALPNAAGLGEGARS